VFQSQEDLRYFSPQFGIVVRYGVGASEGDFQAATSADFATDVATAVKFLSQRPDIRTKQIGLIGHSEGGLVAPMVAAELPEVAFAVLLAGPGVNGEKIIAPVKAHCCGSRKPGRRA